MCCVLVTCAAGENLGFELGVLVREDDPNHCKVVNLGCVLADDRSIQPVLARHARDNCAASEPGLSQRREKRS